MPDLVKKKKYGVCCCCCQATNSSCKEQLLLRMAFGMATCNICMFRMPFRIHPHLVCGGGAQNSCSNFNLDNRCQGPHAQIL